MLPVMVGLMVITVILLYGIASSVNALTKLLAQIAASQIQYDLNFKLDQISTSLSTIEDSISRLEDHFVPYSPNE